MVVRTGLNTCMGSMVRQIISPSYERKEKDPFIQVNPLELSCPMSGCISWYDMRLFDMGLKYANRY